MKKGDSLVLNLVVLLFLASWLGKSANMVCSFQFRNRSATLRIDNREYRNLKLKIVHNNITGSEEQYEAHQVDKKGLRQTYRNDHEETKKRRNIVTNHPFSLFGLLRELSPTQKLR